MFSKITFTVAFDRWESSPLRPGDNMAPRLLRIEHPSAGDLRCAMELLTTTVNSFRGPKFWEIKRKIQQRDEGSDDVFVTDKEEEFYQKTLARVAACEEDRAQFQRFQDDRTHHLGTVFAGSGLHRRRMRQNGQPHILDWALVSLMDKERKAPNAVCFLFF